MGLLSKKTAEAWIRVASPADLPAPGDSLAVRHNGQDYVLFRLEDGLYCTQGSCSHEYSPLCEGLVDGCEVYCEKHGSRFDIRNGAVLSPPADRDLKVFPVKVEGDEVLIFV